MNDLEDIAMRLLQATREQLHGKPTREVEPFEIAQKAGINPYSREYDSGVRYLLDHGYIEHYPNEAVSALGLYRVTNKGLEEILSKPQPPPPAKYSHGRQEHGRRTRRNRSSPHVLLSSPREFF
jgi:hypothetical protein